MRYSRLFNAVLFQLLWFAAVLWGPEGLYWPAGALLIALLVVSLGQSGWRWDLALAAAALPVGFALDTLFHQAGVLNYGAGELAPVWILLLWVGFGLSLNQSLSFLSLRPVLGALAVGVFAPLSYLAGERFGAVRIDEPWFLVFVGLAWALLLLPALLLLARRGPAAAATG